MTLTNTALFAAPSMSTVLSGNRNGWDPVVVSTWCTPKKTFNINGQARTHKNNA